LHLPQYISFLLTGNAFSELTSIGCHTLLWDFKTNHYHSWVYQEKLAEKFPPIVASDKTFEIICGGRKLVAGVGLHDSSSALIPYLACFTEPFILLSTGTWCISLNPFNEEILTEEELENDCLCYLQYDGRQVKASRLFAGNEHETQTKKLSAHFNVPADYWKNQLFRQEIYNRICEEKMQTVSQAGLHHSAFVQRDLSGFADYETAYHQLIADFVQQQVFALKLVIPAKKPSRIFVDGGFARNDLFMKMLALAFPGMDIYAASVSQATALGAALAVHSSWNDNRMPEQLIALKKYSS
jgi:sugar (pentulose or hexulose) kinase